MGNNPSTPNAKAPSSASQSPSPSPSNQSHEPRTPRSRDPRNLIQAQRTGAKPEPSSVQAHGLNVTHRTRNSQSKSAADAHVNQQPSPSQSLNSSTTQTNGSSQMGTQQAKEESKVNMQTEPSKPVDVPIPSSNNNTDYASLRSHHTTSLEPSGPPLTADMSYHLTRPPRLPLPIEEEVHTPGSPIIAPADTDDAPVLDIDPLDDDPLPRRSSALSNNTGEEEDAEELTIDKTKATVPTVFEWREGGDKVYVTGTIFQWNKKQKLNPVEGQPDVLQTVIYVLPGTHHVRFIVDGIMQCSTNLPTTVDFGNNLVNYIEVSADDLPRDAPTPSDDVPEEEAMPPNDEAEPEPKPDEPKEEEANQVKPAPRKKAALPASRFCTRIPQFLIDLDKSEDSSAYQYAAAAIEKLPTPPSLPGFLGKPILNAATPMKDDNSVLIMPNHTVLNHLGTSSIKENVLAVSATTRYKRKYVTTIMYKPTGEDT